MCVRHICPAYCTDSTRHVVTGLFSRSKKFGICLCFTASYLYDIVLTCVILSAGAQLKALKYCSTISTNPSTSKRDTHVTIYSTSVEANDTNDSTLPYYSVYNDLLYNSFSTTVMPLVYSYRILFARRTTLLLYLLHNLQKEKGSSLVSGKNK